MVRKRFLLFYLIVIPSLALPCFENQFQSVNIGGCVDCPEDPNLNCQFEGDDAEACQRQCIKGSSQKDEGNTTEKSGIDRRSQKISDSNKKDEGTGEKPNDVTVEAQSKETSNGSKVAISVGLSAAVCALLLIVGLAVCFHKRTRHHGHPMEHEMENQNGEPNVQRYSGPEIAPDLNKNSYESISSLLERETTV